LREIWAETTVCFASLTHYSLGRPISGLEVAPLPPRGVRCAALALEWILSSGSARYILPWGVFQKTDDRCRLSVAEPSEFQDLYFYFYQEKFSKTFGERFGFWKWLQEVRMDSGALPAQVSAVLQKEDSLYGYLADWEVETRAWFLDLDLPAKTIHRLSLLPRDSVAEWISKLKSVSCTHSERLQMIEWVFDLVMGSKGSGEVWKWLMMLSSDETYSQIRQRRFPNLSFKNTQFKSSLESLKPLPVNLTPASPFWDGDYYLLTARVKSVHDLEKICHRILEKTKRSEWKSLFDLLSVP
jgi:hypothetical protein